MKRSIIKFLIVAILTAGSFSCADDKLDPLQFNFVGKGAILTLRGQQLQNIYFLGKPGAELFPRIMTGAEKFEFDAEFLATDENSLDKVEIFVIKRVPSGNTINLVRVPLMEIPSSAFQKTSDYVRPWTSVSIDVTDILEALELDYTDPDDIETLLDLYKFGISIESDLTLKDGSKVLAADIVASGLFQSNQFYPAQRLTYAVTDYCSYDNSEWAGSYSATESSEFFGGWGPYTVNLTQDGTDPDKFHADNWYDSGIPIYIIFEESFDVVSQEVNAPSQPNPNNPARSLEGSGTYNQCTNEITMFFTYKQGDTVLDSFLWKLSKN